MGYTTEFEGSIAVEPPLDAAEVAYLRKFSQTRRMYRAKGPYFVEGAGEYGQGHDSDIIDYNRPPEGQPGLWCQWTPAEDGRSIGWDGGEKFYEAARWMSYLVEHFLGSAPRAASQIPFLKGHRLSGTIAAQGEDPSDRWLLTVDGDTVTVSPR